VLTRESEINNNNNNTVKKRKANKGEIDRAEWINKEEDCDGRRSSSSSST
jgi:hypothetical protein